MNTLTNRLAGERTQENIGDYGFVLDLSGCSLHWHENMRELTIRSAGKIGLPFGDQIRALSCERIMSPEVVAAAPELLEACKALLSDIPQPSNDFIAQFPSAAVRAARAAIAKAERQEQ